MPETPTLLIRADASSEMGTGHVMRCLALAQAARDFGYDVVFIAKRSAMPLAPRIEAERCHIEWLADDADPAADVRLTLAAANREKAAWIVVDGYHFTADYRRRLRTERRLLMIDDHGGEIRDTADLVLNQNLHADPELYPEMSAASLLLGPRYAPLRREFAPEARTSRPHPETARRILVTFGGSDPDNAASDALDLLAALATRHDDLRVTILTGMANRHRHIINAKSENMPFLVSCRENVSDVAPVMAAHEVAIAAAGTTTYELMAMGLPAVMTAIADSQKPTLAQLRDADLALTVDTPARLRSPETAAMVSSFLQDRVRRQTMGEAGQQLVDGLGARRALATFAGLNLREVRMSDREWVWQLSNRPEIRAVSFHQEEIPWETHVAWFERTIGAADNLFLIATTDTGRRIGQIRFQAKDHQATVSVSLDPWFHSCGYGKRIIAIGTRQLFAAKSEVVQVLALTKPENHASLRAFVAAGYQRQTGTGNILLIKERP